MDNSRVPKEKRKIKEALEIETAEEDLGDK